ncbi:MAG: hypothetical protein GY884_31960 [Proteobacteria bacterium]|nr:hypothetical protein [Pseudomonadota bacterium]
MRLAVIGDIHAHLGRLERVLAHIDKTGVDGILQVGDIGDHSIGRRRPSRHPKRVAMFRSSVASVLMHLRKLGVPVYWVPGNHDLKDTEGPGQIDGKRVELGDYSIYGIGGAGPDLFGFPYEWTENDIVQRHGQPDCDILVCHAPPKDTPLDLVPHRGLHVGSTAIRDICLEHRGVVVCGHIHESPGVMQIGESLVMNAGGLGEPWGGVRVGYVEDLDRIWVQDLDSGWRQEISRS